MCGLLFEHDIRLSVKLYFAKSYMNIRTITKPLFELRVIFRDIKKYCGIKKAGGKNLRLFFSAML